MRIKNLPLIVGIALPVVFIAVVSVIIFLPSLRVKPQHNFIYTIGPYYYSGGYQTTYEVRDGRIVLWDADSRPDQVPAAVPAAIYLYDVVADTSRQISFEDAKEYVLVPGPSSPDGYTVDYQYQHDGIFELFGSNDNDSGYFISKDGGKKRLNAFPGNPYRSWGEFRLVGWVQ